MASQDSDAAEMKRLINYDDESGEEEQNESMDSGDSDEEGEQESDPDVDSDSDPETEEEVATTKTKLKKRTLKDRLAEEQEIRDKEKRMRLGEDAPRDIDDFERLLVANQD